MRRMMRGLKAAAGVLCLSTGLFLGLGTGLARATPTSSLDLQVTFAGTLSVAVDGMQYSTRTLNGGANALVVASSATVTNDSAGLTESWQLSVSTVSGGGDWAVQGSTLTPPDVDQFAFQALFTSSATTSGNQPGTWSGGCPAPNATDWNVNASTVTQNPALYTTYRYADSTIVGAASGDPDVTSGPANGNMLSASSGFGHGTRGLCARIYMPSGTETTQPQVIRLTITAAPGN